MPLKAVTQLSRDPGNTEPLGGGVLNLRPEPADLLKPAPGLGRYNLCSLKIENKFVHQSWNYTWQSISTFVLQENKGSQADC